VLQGNQRCAAAERIGMSSPIYKAVARHLSKTKFRFTPYDKPRRFIYEKRPLKGRKGLTKNRYFQEIESDDPRYDFAPFEEGIVHLPE